MAEVVEPKTFKTLKEVKDHYWPNHEFCGNCNHLTHPDGLTKCSGCEKLLCNYCTESHRCRRYKRINE